MSAEAARCDGPPFLCGKRGAERRETGELGIGVIALVLFDAEGKLR